MITYIALLGLTMLALFLLGGLIGGLAWRRFGKPEQPTPPQADGPGPST